ncbi:phage tail protein I [uncultured Megasphaera sp.]|uniref:phage tail protein I n=1 Tax=uncultured Megasphaera sp. TaxID=165188 RepID=UPI00266CE8FF|nr:phage tail protein I [uncultured Megasphaera sp.]
MNNLDELDLSKLLPSSISSDEEVQALSDVVTKKLLHINANINALLLWKDLSIYDDTVLLHLAWGMHTDLYDEGLARQTREQMIRSSILWHMKKGTLYSVELALRMVFKTGIVEEWFNYGAAPYHFRVRGVTESIENEDKINKLLGLINLSKNLRSWCDSIEFERHISGNCFIGAGVMEDEEIFVSSDLKDEFNWTQNISIGASIMDDSAVDINTSII